MGPSPGIPLERLTKFCQVGFRPKVPLRALDRELARLRPAFDNTKGKAIKVFGEKIWKKIKELAAKK